MGQQRHLQHRHLLSYAPVERRDRRRFSDAVDAAVGVGCTLFALGCFVALILHFMRH